MMNCIDYVCYKIRKKCKNLKQIEEKQEKAQIIQRKAIKEKNKQGTILKKQKAEDSLDIPVIPINANVLNLLVKRQRFMGQNKTTK